MTPFGVTALSSTEVFIDPIGDLVFTILFLDLDTDLDTPSMLQDTASEVITAIDTIGIMPMPPIPGVLVAIQTLILPEVDAPPKDISVQILQGTVVTEGQTATTTPQVPAGTT